MTEAPDDLEKLLADVRKTISENKQFLEKLVSEASGVAAEGDSTGDLETIAGEDDFEEL